MSGASPQLSDADDKESHTSSPDLARRIRRSSSFPAWAKKITPKIFLNTKSGEERKDLNQKGKAKQSVTVNEILASGEVRQEPSLPAKDQSHLKPQSENSRASNVHGQDATQPLGSVHQRRMRTVSQDDCLNERGANPRTGIVTPSNSLEGSNDEPKTLQTTETTKKSKW